MAEGKNRPILITILAILYFVIGLLTVFSGIVLALGITAIDTDLALTGAAGGGIVAIVGLINIIIAGGFWNGWRIMWYLGVIFTIIELIFGIASIFIGGFIGIVPIIIDAIILYYLFRPNVKEFFGI